MFRRPREFTAPVARAELEQLRSNNRAMKLVFMHRLKLKLDASLDAPIAVTRSGTDVVARCGRDAIDEAIATTFTAPLGDWHEAGGTETEPRATWWCQAQTASDFVMNLSLILALASVASSPMELDPMGVLPLILNEGVVHGPLIARAPFVVQWRDGLLCVGDARPPAPHPCVRMGPDGRGLTVRWLGRGGLLLVRAPASSTREGMHHNNASVVVLSAHGVVFAADDVVDVHLHDDAVDVGLRCGPTIPAPAVYRYCPVHQYGAQERISVRVVDGALSTGEPRTHDAEDGRSWVKVLVDGRKSASFLDDGLWRSRTKRGNSMLDPHLSEIEDDESIEGPTHVDLRDAHLTARGVLRVTPTDDPSWNDNRANLERWRAASPRIVRGMSPATPIELAFSALDVCSADGLLGTHDIMLLDERCGRTIRISTWSEEVITWFHEGAYCAIHVSEDPVQCAEPGVILTWTGGSGSDECSTLFTGACPTAERVEP